MTPVARVEVSGQRMSGEVDVSFTLDRAGQRCVEFGGTNRRDETNVVRINGVDYVAASVRVADTPKGWRVTPNGWGLTRLEFDAWADAHPTEAAGWAFREWCTETAPRLAETHHRVWAGVLAEQSRPRFDEREQELRDHVRRLRVERELWELVDIGEQWRIDRWPEPKRAHWQTGFLNDDRHSTSAGRVHGRLLVEVGGEWVEAGLVCVDDRNRRQFLPAELVTLR